MYVWNVTRIGQEVEITGTVEHSCQRIVTETEVTVNKLCKTVYLCPFNPVTLGFEVFFFCYKCNYGYCFNGDSFIAPRLEKVHM